MTLAMKRRLPVAVVHLADLSEGHQDNHQDNHQVGRQEGRQDSHGPAAAVSANSHLHLVTPETSVLMLAPASALGPGVEVAAAEQSPVRLRCSHSVASQSHCPSCRLESAARLAEVAEVHFRRYWLTCLGHCLLWAADFHTRYPSALRRSEPPQEAGWD